MEAMEMRMLVTCVAFLHIAKADIVSTRVGVVVVVHYPHSVTNIVN
jgi:hypothetical protein